jgi:hypothetical protein
VVVIDFVANWLLRRLRKPAGKVAGKLKAIGKKILAKLKKAAKKVGRKLKAAAKKIGRKLKAAGRRLKQKLSRKKKRVKGKDKKKPKKSKDQKARERLQRAVEAIRPQVERMLARGTSKLALRAKLLYWRVRYRLSSLSVDGQGRIVAKINPELTVASGRVVPNEELGRLIQSVLSGAEHQLEKQLLAGEAERARFEEASDRFRGGESGSLEGMPRALQAKALRERRPMPEGKGRAKVQPETDVNLSVAQGHLGQVEVKMGRLGRYSAMLASIQRRAKQFGVPESEIAALLATPPDRLPAALGSLSPGISPRTKTEARQLRTFLHTIKRTAFLTQALEPARERGVAAAHAVGLSLVQEGVKPPGEQALGLRDVLDPEGRMAPMTPKGAASKTDSPERRVAVQARRDRIGYIFATLVRAAESGEIVTGPGGADLTPLANAVRRLVEAFFAGKRDIEEVRKSVGLLKAQIRALLARYNGR